ncbi:MAG: Glyoxalase family protein [uncultured Acidimicrobiales bacterium]|uniref:Glyoxalase family protein n=1 Tax=uncultured Acidimicrobiales bacterium TaxID=310071 RepID=A0A6J4HC93_9ACTN|nr:MAG: Glyoxalase family protein [uncultured Acidimicrobiales bacterium]
MAAAATSRKVFINLAVEDLQRSIDFFTALGFGFDQQFTDEQATCMILSEEAYVMLLVKSRFQDFVKKQIADSTKDAEVILALSADSREEVDELVEKALAAGGSPSNDKMDMGFMYGWSFQDPDGHLWEVMHMDPDAVQPA